MADILSILAQAEEPAATSPSVSDEIWFVTLGFGAIALLLVGVVQFYRTMKRPQASFIPFARTYGLIVVATLAAALTLSSVDLDAKTGAFALLGTIAGYLAATATTNATPDAPAPQLPTPRSRAPVPGGDNGDEQDDTSDESEFERGARAGSTAERLRGTTDDDDSSSAI